MAQKRRALQRFRLPALIYTLSGTGFRAIPTKIPTQGLASALFCWLAAVSLCSAFRCLGQVEVVVS